MLRIVQKCFIYAGIVALVITTGCQQPPQYLRSKYSAPEKSGSQYEGTNPDRPRVKPRMQPDAKSGPLGLAECINIAVNNSPRARMSWQKARASEAQVGVAQSGFYPQLDFSANVVRSKSQVLTEVEDIYHRTTYDGRFGVRQLLFDGGQTQYQVWASQAALRSADFKHNQTLQEIALNTERTYYQLLTSKGQLEVAKEMVKQRKQHLEMAQRELDAGRGRRADVLQVEARLAEARFNVVDAENQVRKLKGRLNAVMGLSPDREVQIKDMPEKVNPQELKDIDKLIAMAAEHRPQLRSAAEDVTRWRNLVHSEKSKRLPTISANASYGWKDVHFAPEEKEEYTLSVGLEWPLFTGYETSYSIRQARARLQESIQSYQESLRNVELEVWNAFSEIVRARESINMAQSYISSAEESLHTTERGYKNGRATVVELIDAQTELTRAQMRRLRAHLQWFESIARVERAVGKILRKDSDQSSVLRD